MLVLMIVKVTECVGNGDGDVAGLQRCLLVGVGLEQRK